MAVLVSGGMGYIGSHTTVELFNSIILHLKIILYNII